MQKPNYSLLPMLWDLFPKELILLKHITGTIYIILSDFNTIWSSISRKDSLIMQVNKVSDWTNQLFIQKNELGFVSTKHVLGLPSFSFY